MAEKVGLRPDIPPQWFRGPLTKATAVVHRRLIASARPEVRATICDVLAKVSQEVGSRGGPRDYSAAQRVVLSLDRANQLNEAALTAFCAEGKYEETVVALATLAKAPLKVADRLMAGARPDAARTSTQGLDTAFANYGRLSASTAQRVVRFWQVAKPVSVGVGRTLTAGENSESKATAARAQPWRDSAYG